VTYPSRLHGPEAMAAYRQAPRTPRWSIATLRAALWTFASLRVTAWRLRRLGTATVVSNPPVLDSGSRRGVEAVLRRASPTCLERCLVLQKWLLTHGIPCEVVIGVKHGADGGVEAHAWLDVESDEAQAREFVELHRLAPR
jgi:hypothetical protein